MGFFGFDFRIGFEALSSGSGLGLRLGLGDMCSRLGRGLGYEFKIGARIWGQAWGVGSGFGFRFWV